MQDLAADSAHWRALARGAEPGWCVWRWEVTAGRSLTMVWKLRLPTPGEKPEGLGDIMPQ